MLVAEELAPAASAASAVLLRSLRNPDMNEPVLAREKKSFAMLNLFDARLDDEPDDVRTAWSLEAVIRFWSSRWSADTGTGPEWAIRSSVSLLFLASAASASATTRDTAVGVSGATPSALLVTSLLTPRVRKLNLKSFRVTLGSSEAGDWAAWPSPVHRSQIPQPR